MSWTLFLQANKEITEKDMDEIVENLLEPYKSHSDFLQARGISVKQSWGWSTPVDIYLPEGKTLRLSGSYAYSGHIAKEFAAFLKSKLEEKGYVVNVGERR